MEIDAYIDTAFKPVADFLSSIVFYSVPVGLGLEVKLILVWICLVSVFFTFYLGFVNFRFFRHAIDVVRGKFDRPSHDGQINSWQALMASMAGTVGLGNIAGVAVAVTIGGPGAIFWMIVMGFLSMSTKFAEVTLGVKYRQHTSKEHPESLSGGPMYFLRDGFAARGHAALGKILAAVFAVCCIAGSIGGGNMFQANQAFKITYDITGGEAGFLHNMGWAFGVGLALLVGIVIIGGIKSIANVSSRLVPAMAIIYMAAGLVVIIANYQNIPGAFAEIFRDALTPEAGLAGVLGALLVGVQRAAFSNEAGLGSAAIMYAAAKTDLPARQGMASMLGPFIDTVIICTMTGLIIVISGEHMNANGMEGVELTSRALETGAGWFPYVLALTVFLFAYSTLIGWAYYGIKCLTYLCGDRDWVQTAYKLFYCLCVVIGTSSQLDNIIAFTDAMMLSMAIPNVIGLYLLAPEVRREMDSYIKKLKKA